MHFLETLNFWNKALYSVSSKVGEGRRTGGGVSYHRHPNSAGKEVGSMLPLLTNECAFFK